MRIGVKLDIGYSEDIVYRQLFGARDIIDHLVALGVTAIETAVGPETDDRDLRVHARRCHEAGLRLSLHPYTEGTSFNPAFFARGGDNPCDGYHSRLLTLASEIAAIQVGEVIVNIHSAAAGRDVERWKLVRRSIRFFDWARAFCENEIAGVRVVAELQYSPNENEGIQRIGDSFGELFFICVESGVGACWDFGHAYMNERRYGLSATPPDQLWRYITHVHCHDVYLGDHFPLVYDRVPWREYLGGLLERSFDGTLIIEVPPELYVMSGGLESLEKSVGLVRAFIDGYPNHEN